MKPRNLIVRATLACVCLTAWFSWTSSPAIRVAGVRQDRATLGPEEIQRLVYSGHLLVVLKAKPELEAGLLGLLELRHQDAAASPASLVTPVKLALAEYRKEALSSTAPGTQRDAVLGRYFLKLCDVLPPAERRTVALNLLNILLAQEDPSSLWGQQAGPLQVGGQHLLAVANGPAERHALAKSCMRQAQTDPTFATAMDALLRPEIGIALNAPPSEILAVDPALAQSPTMQELMRASSSSEDGSVAITMDALKALFVAETAVVQSAARTHWELQGKIGAAPEDLVRSPDHAAGVAVIVQEQAHQATRIAVASVAANALSEMTLPINGKLASHLEGASKTFALFGTAIAQLGGLGANPAGAVGGVFSLFAAGLQWSSMAAAARQESPDETILASIKLVGEMISGLSDRVEYRLDRVDRSLVNILSHLGDVHEDVDQVRNDLVKAQASLDRLEREFDSYLTAGFARPLVQQIEGSLGYKTRTGESMTSRQYERAENQFHTWAAHLAGDDLASPKPRPGDLNDVRVLVQLNSRPLNRNLNYVKTFLKERLGVSSLPDGTVASLADWYVGASAYLRLAAENPEHFRRINPERLDEVIQAGAELEHFFRALTFVESGSGAEINRKLFEAALSYYEDKLNAFKAAVGEAEKRFNRDTDFDVTMWRDWEARAPRLKVAETAVIIGSLTPRKVTPLRVGSRVVGLGESGEPVEHLFIMEDGRLASRSTWPWLHYDPPSDLGPVVAASAQFGEKGMRYLALRQDGTVVVWGDFDPFWGKLPDGLSKSRVVSIATSTHCLALRSDGTVVSWGQGLGYKEQYKVSEPVKDAVAIAAGNRRSLALLANGTVVGWGEWLGWSGRTYRPGSDAVVKPALDKVVAIAVGSNHYLALKADGTVVAWGDNGFGQCNVPRGLADVVAIATGVDASFALKTDGSVAAWGRNDHGECDFVAAQTGVLALAEGGVYPTLLVSPATPGDYPVLQLSRSERIANTQPLAFVRGEPPPAVRYRLLALCDHVLSNFDRDLNDSLSQLTGAKTLLESVLALGLPDSLEQDGVLRGSLFGSESIIDREGARALYEAERLRLGTAWRLRASTLEPAPRARLDSFRRRLNGRLDTLQQSGTPEIPRMLAQPLLQLRLLRAAY